MKVIDLFDLTGISRHFAVIIMKMGISLSL